MKQIFTVILMFVSVTLCAQNIEELQSQRRAAQVEIARIDGELKGVESSKKSSEQKLALIKKRIREREKVVSNIESQIGLLSAKQDTQSLVINSQQQRLEQLKDYYKRSILMLHRSYISGGFRSPVLSCDTRQKIMRRSYFTSIFVSVIEAQAKRIGMLKEALGDEINHILTQKELLLELKEASDAEIKLIGAERRQVEQMNASFKKEEKSLLARRGEQRAALDALQREIERIVRAEIAASKNSERNAPLSGEFAAAKGRLISPLKGSAVIDTYGIHNHPTEKGLKVDNKGVNLQGRGSADVRAVFAGQVKRVFVVPGMGRSVLIRHGEYITVYSSLANVNVLAGQKVAGGDIIGQVETDGILHFEIWKENTTQNPQRWVMF